MKSCIFRIISSTQNNLHSGEGIVDIVDELTEHHADFLGLGRRSKPQNLSGIFRVKVFN